MRDDVAGPDGSALSDGLGAGAEVRDTPKPPRFCRQCADSRFDWYGVAAFKCRGCGDVAHWLSPKQRTALRAALEAANVGIEPPKVGSNDGLGPS